MASQPAAVGGGEEGGESLSPADEANIFINQIDGLPNEHPIHIKKNASLTSIGSEGSEEENSLTESGDGRGRHGTNRTSFTPNQDDDLCDDLPTSIIVTNIHSEVFVSEDLKAEMEALFRTFSDAATFHWLKSFKRLRVNFDTSMAAANARVQLHQYQFHNSVISCYFAQPVTPVSHKNLQPPPLTKQFLISPPASPPAGWEPREENEPLVNHDLLAALANLTPGESHEVHPQTESQPAIIVHTALTAAGVASAEAQKITQTKCPERAVATTTS